MNDGYSVANHMAVPSGMMRIKLLASIVVTGHPGVRVGDIFDVPGHVGWHLIANRWAEEVAAPVPQPEVIQMREPEVQNRDPQPMAAPPQTQPGKSSPRKPAK